MGSQIEINDRFETQDIRAANPKTNDGLKIEEILRRAQEIHRERGGVFGYDIEDWFQAWGELPERDNWKESDPIKANRAE